MGPNKIVIAFDLYGTLLSTESIATELGKLFGDDKGDSLAGAWRRYQLEYTWRLNSMGEDQYQTFSQVTRNSLKHAILEHELEISEKDVEHLMKSYDALHVFPDVPAALKLLAQKSDVVDVYVFSNGTVDMVGTSIKSSPDLGPHAGLFKGLITVDPVKAYKPSMKVYSHLLHEVGKQESKGDVWLVSGNPFDAVGAKAAGLRTAWVDRAGKGWVDRLDPLHAPTVITTGVEDAVKAILHWSSNRK